jgi:hypothetical protein
MQMHCALEYSGGISVTCMVGNDEEYSCIARLFNLCQHDEAFFVLSLIDRKKKCIYIE